MWRKSRTTTRAKGENKMTLMKHNNLLNLDTLLDGFVDNLFSRDITPYTVNPIKNNFPKVFVDEGEKDYTISLAAPGEKKEDFDRFQDELNQISHDAVKIGGKIDKNKARLKHLESELDNIGVQIHQYYEHEEKIKKKTNAP